MEGLKVLQRWQQTCRLIRTMNGFSWRRYVWSNLLIYFTQLNSCWSGGWQEMDPIIATIGKQVMNSRSFLGIFLKQRWTKTSWNLNHHNMNPGEQGVCLWEHFAARLCLVWKQICCCTASQARVCLFCLWYWLCLCHHFSRCHWFWKQICFSTMRMSPLSLLSTLSLSSFLSLETDLLLPCFSSLFQHCHCYWEHPFTQSSKQRQITEPNFLNQFSKCCLLVCGGSPFLLILTTLWFDLREGARDLLIFVGLFHIRGI